MQLSLAHKTKEIQGKLTITGSKSETNRLLLLQALYPDLTIENKSNSDDSVAMERALVSKENIKDIHHAGTAMRFLTAYFATKNGGNIVLTGSQRMQERPIALLVDALRKLGAQINYSKQEGYPPLEILGKQLAGGKVGLPANMSSQYISALLLIAPRLKQGLELELEGEITSLPYIKMTLALLKRVGITSSFEGKIIRIPHQERILNPKQTVESDWSSASYWFSAVALCDQGQIELSNYREDSLQGDAVLREIYAQLGVESKFVGSKLLLRKKENFTLPASLELDLVEAPDIAQTIAVTCYGLGVACHLTGLHTLKIKETDRLVALENELSKLGAKITIDNESLRLAGEQDFQANQAIDTYNDHRMAMAFAPLALKLPIIINDAGVVSKSYPDFWNDIENIGYQVIKN